MTEADVLLSKVVDGGYCSGCGVCAAVPDSPLEMELDQNRCFRPMFSKSERRQSSNDAKVLDVCPFYNDTVNEDVLGKGLFDDQCQFNDKIGYFLETYAGYVVEGDFRRCGSSGGLGSWLIAELFTRGLIDGVIHVRDNDPTPSDRRLFKFAVSFSMEEARQGSKSKYYPIELSEVLKIVRDRPGRYAIVGVPCFLKAVRLLVRSDKTLAQRLHYFIGLVCGHLKSAFFAEMLAWREGITPDGLERIDFRQKVRGQPADNYSILLEGSSNGQKKIISRPISSVYEYDWGKGLFKYEACDYCDDVFAEVADITIGDAWLREYVTDGMGTNVVIVRTRVFADIIQEAVQLKKLALHPISVAEVIKSQEAGLRHRREGLSYRLALKDQADLWRPVKRVEPCIDHLTDRQKEIFGLRIKIRQEAFVAFIQAKAKGDWQFFRESMWDLFRQYDELYRGSFILRMKHKLDSFLRTFETWVRMDKR